MFYPVKLITGVLYPDERWREWVIEKVTAVWGEIDAESEPVPFDLTNYYHDIAPTLYRQFLSFKGLRHGGDIVDGKKRAVLLKKRAARHLKTEPYEL